MTQVIKINDAIDLVPTSQYKHGHWEFPNFNPIQSKLFEVYDQDSNIGIAASTAAGKAQPLNAKILTPKGFVRMGDVKVGDLAISSSGDPTPIFGVFPQGVKHVFRVTFSDGATTTCCEDHLWSVRTKSDKHKGKPWRTKSLKDLMSDLKYKDGQNKWYIPLIEPSLAGNKRYGDNFYTDLPLRPYVLGAILGDGGIIHRVILSSADEELIERTQSLLPDGVLVEFLEGYDWQIVGGMSEFVPKTGLRRTNFVKQKLQELGLFGLGSCEKFIPQMYLDADPNSRYELLLALMDTDGAYNGGKSAEFTSCSYKLAGGVAQLARSLGAATRVRDGKSGYKNEQGEFIECEPRYRVTVNLGDLQPFSLSRKASQQETGLSRGRNRSITRIDYIGMEECQCISVAAYDHLYVTDDYILTHNTVCAEIYLAHVIRQCGGKGIYVGPLKALAKEKEQDWTEDKHHFSDLKTFIATGDYRFTEKRIKEMDESDLVVMTPEMLASRCRSHKSDKSRFLYDVKCIVFDESHLLTVPSRGDHIEVALMKLTDINPDVKIVLLSATMPNVDEICGWVSRITGRDTYYLESDYRPCPLNIHYETYYDGDRDYDAKELQKVGTAASIVEYYDQDKFLIFAHTKRTGAMMVETLERYGVKSEFHSADLGLKDRMELEYRFKNDKDFRVLVATSSLAWGVNTPARRVIVLGVHRAFTEVENYDIGQMIGRAGRPKYDTQGDAYILVPESLKKEWIARLKKKTPIQSTLFDHVGKEDNPHYKTLAFHIVAEIHQGNVKTREAFHAWIKRSLAYFQDPRFDTAVMDRTIALLEECGAIFKDDEGLYQCTAIGKIASMFYYSPFDVSDLKRNFKKLFEDKWENDDFAISLALGNIDSYRWSICNRSEKEAISQYKSKIEKMYGKDKYFDPVLKHGCAYFFNMKGKKDVPVMNSTQMMVLADLDRTFQVLMALDSMSGLWGKAGWFKNVNMRIKYGVESDLVELCQIPNVGAARAKKLKAARIKTVGDFLDYDAAALAKIMKVSDKVAEESLNGARLLALQAAAGS